MGGQLGSPNAIIFQNKTAKQTKIPSIEPTGGAQGHSPVSDPLVWAYAPYRETMERDLLHSIETGCTRGYSVNTRRMLSG